MLREQPRLGLPTFPSRFLALAVSALVLLAASPPPTEGQVPNDRVHVSLSLGGYVMLGIGITHWIEEHHAIEATLFPFGFPWEGMPAAVKLGYAWTPSDEVWRAKLGGNLTVLRHRHPDHLGGFIPILAFTPGLQYDPTDQRSIRFDFWMSYFLTESVFAPTGLEIIHAWK